MAVWAYEIVDKNGNIVETDSGYETESEAEVWGVLSAKAMKLPHYSIATRQVWKEIE